MRLPDGVWVGKDIEILRAGEYEVVYQRTKTPVGIQASLRRLSYEEDGCMSRRTIGLVFYASGSNDIAYVCSSKLDYLGANITSANATGLNLTVETSRLSIEEANEIVACSDNYLETYSSRSALLRDNKVCSYYELEKSDDITICSEKDVEATSPLVGSCFARLIKGIKVLDSCNSFVFEMYSNRYTCCFIVNDQYVYCGAGRYAVCEDGMFSSMQGFRIFKSSNRVDAAYMIEDLSLMTQDLVIDKRNFIPKTCTSTPNNTQAEWSPAAGMYFPIKRVETDAIVLEGCNSDYVYNAADYVERFA